MHKKTFLLIVMLLAAFAARSENRWTFYGAYHNSLVNIPTGNAVYSLCDGSLFSFSPSDNEVRTYDKTTGFSDADISYMAYCSSLKCLVLVYSNSNIDIFYPESGSIANLPQLMNSSLSDKTVNDLTVSGTNAYISTGSGLSVVDIKRLEFSKTYTLGGEVNSAVVLDGDIYAALSSGIVKGDVSKNLLDFSNWEKFSSGTFQTIRAFAGKLYGYSRKVYAINSDGSYTTVIADNMKFFCADNSDYLFFGNSAGVYSLSADGTTARIYKSNSFKYLSYADGTYWASLGFDGTQKFSAGADGMLQPSGSAVTLNSPIRNYCAFMNMSPSNRLLVAGGSLNYNGQNYDGTLYSYSNGKFTNFEDTVSARTGFLYRNLTGVAEDPNDPEHVFATSAETGLYEFRNGKYVNHYDYRNSLLQSVLPGDTYAYFYVRTGGLQFDPSGNLWMLNDEVDTVVKILTPEGKWHAIYLDALSKYPTFDHMIFDNAGRAWFTHRRTTNGGHNAGVACLDVNGTLGDTSDDTFTFRYRFTNEDGTTYTPNTVDAIAKDNDGRIWIGTVEGPFLVENPDNFANTDFTFEQVKVPRNDGTDNADYLLTGVPITAIAVDAANRKWFGTKGAGVFLVSADNIETIYNFTSSNSPLVSDNILSLAVNNETGEVMIGTDKGLMSYSEGKINPGNTVKDSDLKIYPNPVRPDYYGDVTIESLPMNAEIKITTTGGQLVRTAKAANGFYKWDVKDSNGAGVGSGVYYVLVVTSDGKHGARGRIVVVR